MADEQQPPVDRREWALAQTRSSARQLAALGPDAREALSRICFEVLNDAQVMATCVEAALQRPDLSPTLLLRMREVADGLCDTARALLPEMHEDQVDKP